MKILAHVGIVAAALLVSLCLPAYCYLRGDAGADAVSSASMDLPDQPSGEFVVILNKDRHPLTLDEWTAFFREEEVGVIMEDISCLTANGDAAGIQLARRYQARLAENQMKITTENGLLVVSRAENGLYDAVILSKELADAWDYSAVYEREDALVLTVSGGEP